jgi:drug/metabolite transporter (DMT)-like permease
MKKLITFLLAILYFILLINNSYAECYFWLCEVSKELQNTWDKDIVASITPSIKYILWFIWLFSLIFIVKWWFQMMFSSWDDEKFKNAKKVLIYSLVGLFVILIAYTLITTVFVSLKEMQ